jgi:2-iminobutanoate/2-iminopropanoate deaminase
MRRTVMADKGPAPAGPYSHAVVANGFVFVSGQGPVNPETGNMPDAFADQVRQTLENVRTILEGMGSSTEDVVKVNAYVTDLTRFTEFNDVYKVFSRHESPRTYHSGRRPARHPGGSRLRGPAQIIRVTTGQAHSRAAATEERGAGSISSALL